MQQMWINELVRSIEAMNCASRDKLSSVIKDARFNHEDNFSKTISQIYLAAEQNQNAAKANRETADNFEFYHVYPGQQTNY